jgi:hypothetical protein
MNVAFTQSDLQLRNAGGIVLNHFESKEYLLNIIGFH